MDFPQWYLQKVVENPQFHSQVFLMKSIFPEMAYKTFITITSGPKDFLENNLPLLLENRLL